MEGIIMPNVFIQAPSENEVLAKIEAISDVGIRNALLALFYWRLATQADSAQSQSSS